MANHVLVLFKSLILCFFLQGGYITVWDVGNFLLDPPSEKNNGDHREDEQESNKESNKEETKKEPKVNCLAHYYHLSPLFFFLHLPVSVVISHTGQR